MQLIRAAVGRPRTALWVGGSEGATFAEERGAKVTRNESAPSDGAFDLIFLTGAAAGERLAMELSPLVPRLEDGGHVVVNHGDTAKSADVLAAIRGAGLDPLWCFAGMVGRPALTVARRPPERRPLSLTVGMISMNEAGAVGKCIDEIREHCPNAEVLLVDSSKDETPEIAEKRGARVLRQFPPRGYGPAMNRLLYSATTDVIVTMDCDGTYPANRIREFHDRIEAGADLVNGSRTHHRPAAMPVANFIANRTFALVASGANQFWTTDVHSGMRAYRTSMLRATYVNEQGPALPVELLTVPARRGYHTEDVDIEYFERIGSTTLHRWDSTLWTFKRIARSAWWGGRVLR